MLELKELTFGYGKERNVLEGISFSVKEGEFISVIGASGAGKTTLMRLLNGALKPRSGEIRMDGLRFDSAKGREKRKLQQKIGSVYQDFCLVEYASCLQNVLNGDLAHTPFWRVLAGCFTKAQKERALLALRQVNMEEKAEMRAQSLSGGQKQRVAIARSLMQEPRLLLADEPVAALDPVTARQILSLLRGLQRERGLTVIMNSHNIASAMEFSDRIIGIREGKVVRDSAPKDMDEAALAEVYEGERREDA